VTLTTHPI